MNRRQSLRALALGSVGAVSPLPAWENPVVPTAKAGEEKGGTQKSDPAVPEYVAAVEYNTIALVAGKTLASQFKSLLPAGYILIEKESLDQQALVKLLADGGAMVWIGSPENLPKELSLGAFSISSSAINIKPADNSPLATDGLRWSNTAAFSAYIAPPKEMPHHNVDEEVRADFLPVLEAHDRFGNLAGYPAALMSYYAPSLGEGRFNGCECFFFFTDDPLQMLDVKGWTKLLTGISLRRESGLQVYSLDTSYSCYRPDERIQVRARIQNRRKRAVSMQVKYWVKAPGAKDFTALSEMRRVAQGGSDTLSLSDFRGEEKEGLWKVRMEIWQDVALAEKLAETGNPVFIDRREIGFVVAREISTKQIMEFKGPSIVLDGKEGFWTGTHYYPSTSWWEWVWRDFRPLKAAEDFAAIRRTGYRIVRVWIDPVIDEPVLRAMDAAILLAAENGIVLDICVFTQWVRQMGFEREGGEQVLFEFRHPKDFNIVSFSLRNLDLQREYVSIIAARWKKAGNIFYNVANEVFVKNPDASQMDAEVLQWKEIPQEKGSKRDTMLFRGWAREMKKAIRSSGGAQPVMPGYMFSTMEGGDVFLGNADSPVIPWHSYLPVDQTALTLQYFDPLSANKPILLEEFGTLGWNSEKNYDGHTHYALAGGAAAAMSYEWGVSWLAREACYWPLPLREAGIGEPDPRWFPPYLELRKAWSEYGTGMCATPSGTGYGSIYHGTPFPAPAAIALARLGLMGKGLQRGFHPEQVYVIIPETNTIALEAVEKTLRLLWEHKVIFGVWQDAELSAIPSSVKIIICPAPLSSSSSALLSNIKSRGVSVYQQSDEWKNNPSLEKLKLGNGDAIDVLVRRTAEGTLFTLAAKKPSENIMLHFGKYQVSAGVRDFGMVHITNKGVMLIQGEGSLKINGTLLCNSNAGRLIIASEDEKSLTDSSTLRLMSSGTGKIVFRRRINAVSISDGFGNMPIRISDSGFMGNVLQVDDQLQKYVIHVTLK